MATYVKPQMLEARRHPIVDIWCREDGAVFVPQSGPNKAHWTFGSCDKDGYRRVWVARKPRPVHRLVAEAFHGLCPSDKDQVDHIDRNPSNNKPENLRWCDRSENQRNRAICDESLAKYGAHFYDDPKTYLKGYRKAYYASKKAAGLVLRTVGGKQRWIKEELV